MFKKTWNKITKKPVSDSRRTLFEETVLPHLSSAYNLARWLTRNEQDAEDVVQESYLRALRFFDTFQPGRDGCAWLLAIVRNTCYTWLRQQRPEQPLEEMRENSPETYSAFSDPETALIEKATSEEVRQAIQALSVEYREVVVLRELEGLSYKEIAQIAGIPIGTVMSRLSRGRKELQLRLGASVRGTRI